MKKWLVFVLPLFLLVATATKVFAQQRHALLIGNSLYFKNVGPLTNPSNDIRLMQKSLEKVGFKGHITVLENLTYDELELALAAYAAKLKKAGPDALGFFYYSGHGAADELGTNYIIPVDVESTASKKLWNLSYRLRDVIKTLSQTAPEAEHFIVFDACRNELKLRRQAINRRGFTRLKRDRLPPGLLLAYASDIGKSASDTGAKAGPYATVLAEQLIKVNVPLVLVFEAVRQTVYAQTGKTQLPHHISRLRKPRLGFASHAGTLPPQSRRAGGGSSWEFTGKSRLRFMRDPTRSLYGPQEISGDVELRGIGSIYVKSALDNILVLKINGVSAWYKYESNWGPAYVSAKDVVLE